MHKRHTLHGARRIPAREGSISSAPPGESGTRIRGADPKLASLEDGIKASIDSAMVELDSLEMPFRASAPPLTTAPAQQMPRGMPPLPFKAPHPANMPPLPLASLRPKSAPVLEPSTPEAPVAPSGKPGRWWVLVALLLGFACLGGALWLQLH